MDPIRRPSPSVSPKNNIFSDNDTDDGDDRVSARSISLSSPTTSVAPSTSNDIYDKDRIPLSASTATMQTHTQTPKPLEAPSLTRGDDKAGPVKRTAVDSVDNMDANSDTVDMGSARSSEAYLSDAFVAATATGVASKPKTPTTEMSSSGLGMAYPPSQFSVDDTESMVSFASSSSKKARPESNLLEPPEGPLVPGICLVDFNHLVGPTIEFSDGEIFEDEQIASILPFLALPDGAHLNAEDYSYFHLVPTSPNPTTVFGISCNRQIKSTELLAKDEDVTRSTVQKAVVVLATKPLFGPIRDKLGVVTRALFEQRDFRDMNILGDFRVSLELSLRTQLTESALYMGTNLRELVHKFRWRTLLLLKTLMLQKRIMFFGHPVERLCTYQYSLISLIPGLLQTLEDSGSPPLASRAPTLSRATSLRTSDRKSLLAYLGLPLDIFGKDAFFQPYIPLQQVDMIKDTRSWLCGSTNSIVTQQKEVDLLVNIETNTFEFRDPNLERLVGLTPADRAWMDEVIRDVNEHWHNDDKSSHRSGLQFRGSEDYLRAKFEEYVTGALASVKYTDFLSKGSDILINGEAGDANAIQDFNLLWIQDFKRTNAFEVWNRITDPMLFDIVEARHPCVNKPNVVADIGLRLSEGLQELHLDQQLAPAREAVSRTIASGSTSFFRAVEGMRERWVQKSPSNTNLHADASASTSSLSSAPVEVSRSEIEEASGKTATPPNGLKPLSLGGVGVPSTTSAANTQQQVVSPTPATDVKATLGSWGTSIGSFISQRTARFTSPTAEQTSFSNPQTTASTTLFTTSPPAQTSASPFPPRSSSTNSVSTSTSQSRPTSTTSTTSSFSFALGRASLLSSRLSSSIGSVVSKQTNRPAAEKDSDAMFQPKDLGEFDGRGQSQAQTPVRSFSDGVAQRGSVETSVVSGVVPSSVSAPVSPPRDITSDAASSPVKTSGMASTTVVFPAGQ